MPTMQAAEGGFDQELVVLTEIGQLLSSTLELRDAFGKMMQIISDKLEYASRGAGDARRIDRPAAHGSGNRTDPRRNRARQNTHWAKESPETWSRPAGRGLSPICGPSRTSSTAPAVSIPRTDPTTASCASPSASAGGPPGHFRSTSHSSTKSSFAAITGSLTSSPPSLHKRFSSIEWSCAQKEELLEENAQLRAQVRDRFRFENIIGDSPAMHEVFAVVGQVANSRATVLLLGETGTGKEMIAKAIHYNSPRSERPFIRVNCGALTGTLLESELFGHVKGSFTGAIRDKIGRFEAADGGTIFLDEIGTLEPQLQVKLLRVLQEREFERVGDTQTVKVGCAGDRRHQRRSAGAGRQERRFARICFIGSTSSASISRRCEIVARTFPG